MKFKLSHYNIVTDSLSDEQSESAKRVLFATRTAKSMVITNRLYDKLQREAWDELAPNDFDKLLAIEAIVPQSEIEVKTIIERNQAKIK